MTPNEFITKWRASELKERSASQEHFIDLCRLLDEPTPAEADPTGETYCFERGARRDAGGDGWADVWKRHYFAWEYKGRRANLDAAFNQLRQYALALENPPLLIVSDMVRFRIRTNWTNSVSRTHEFELDDLADAATRDRLKWAFSDPDQITCPETGTTATATATIPTAKRANLILVNTFPDHDRHESITLRRGPTAHTSRSSRPLPRNPPSHRCSGPPRPAASSDGVATTTGPLIREPNHLRRPP